MPDGRGARFALEAAFLVAVAAVLAFTDLEPAWIVVVMLVAWAVVALLEWAAWRERPHWASGSPPRYYVPQEPLPPRPPSTELPAFTAYPRAEVRETESPTWIATPAMREELLGWPAPPPQEQPTTVEELSDELLAEAAVAGWPDVEPDQARGDRWDAVELPVEPEPELQPPSAELSQAGDAVPPVDQPVLGEQRDDPSRAEGAAVPAESAVPEPERDNSSQAGATAEPAEPTVPEQDRDDLSQAEEAALPAQAAAPEASDDLSQAEEAALPAQAAAAEASDDLSQAEGPAALAELQPAADARDDSSRAGEDAEPAVAAPAPRHRIDPFAEANGRRWPWTRRGEESAAVAELPPLPRHVRILPREEER